MNNKEKLNDLIQNWLNGNNEMNLIFIDELKNFGSNQLFEYKVKRVYRKLIVSKKYSLAKKVKSKYHRILEPKSDLVMAFGLSLMTVQKIKQNGK